MSNKNIPDAAFFSWLDEHIKAAEKRVGRAAINGQSTEYARAVTRSDTLREVRAYFGGAS